MSFFVCRYSNTFIECKDAYPFHKMDKVLTYDIHVSEHLHEQLTLISTENMNNYETLQNSEKLLTEIYNDDIVYAIDFQFKFQSMDRSVVLQFNSSVDGPRREEVILLKFDDFGKFRKISASIDHIYHQFFPKGTITNIKHDAYLMTIVLKGVTEQSL